MNEFKLVNKKTVVNVGDTLYQKMYDGEMKLRVVTKIKPGIVSCGELKFMKNTATQIGAAKPTLYVKEG